ncbi:COMM domain-containing protein 5 [Halotydeus destructor]|nr:COMM domain-containing protein 5 [Halotydeus destructor]
MELSGSNVRQTKELFQFVSKLNEHDLENFLKLGVSAVNSGRLDSKYLQAFDAKSNNFRASLGQLISALKLHFDNPSMDEPSKLPKQLIEKLKASPNVPRPLFIESCMKLQSMSWRIDVLISGREQSKILEPVIVIDVNLSKGKRIRMELTLSSFDKLRFSTASALMKLCDIEQRPMMASR